MSNVHPHPFRESCLVIMLSPSKEYAKLTLPDGTEIRIAVDRKTHLKFVGLDKRIKVKRHPLNELLGLPTINYGDDNVGNI